MDDMVLPLPPDWSSTSPVTLRVGVSIVQSSALSEKLAVSIVMLSLASTLSRVVTTFTSGAVTSTCAPDTTSMRCPRWKRMKSPSSV